MNILIWTLSICVVLFQISDWWTTTRVLKQGGVELNPVMRWIFSIFGQNLGLVLCKFYVSALALAGAYLGWFESKGGLSMLAMLFALYGAVVINNVGNIKRSE